MSRTALGLQLGGGGRWGIGVFVLWVGLTGSWTTQDALWIKLGWSLAPDRETESAHEKFGSQSGLARVFLS